MPKGVKGQPRGEGHFNYKHGLKGTPIYNIWINMRRRCGDPKNPQWPYYGGRGIAVCDRWLNDVAAFSADMGPRPSRRHGIERKNNDLGYSPDNCVWATAKEQANNRRSSRIYTHNGKTQCAADWAKELGIRPSSVARRLKKRSVGDALAPVSYRRAKLLTLDGRTQTLPEWALELGVKEATLWGRVTNGWSDARVLSTPLFSKGGRH